MSEKTFTSEDYDEARQVWESGDDADGFYETISAAMRVAARVMEPGVIEATIAEYTGPDPTGIVAAAIRRALTETDHD